MATREMLKRTVEERAARPVETIAGLACLLVGVGATGLHFYREHAWEWIEAIMVAVILSAGFFLLAPSSARSWATSVTTFWKREKDEGGGVE